MLPAARTNGDSFGSLVRDYDVYVPRFQVFVGPARSPGASEASIVPLQDALDEERRRIKQRISRATTTSSSPSSPDLVPLAGPHDAAARLQTHDVQSVTFKESVGPEAELTQVEIEVHNVYNTKAHRFRYTDRTEGDGAPLLDYGKAVVLSLGYKHEPNQGEQDQGEEDHGGQILFEGTIVSLNATFPADGEPTVTVTAVDHRERLRSLREVQSLHDTSLEGVASHICARAGLRIATREATQRTAIAGRVRVPRDQDFCQFLVDRARRAALELGALGETVFLLSPGDRQPSRLRYRYGHGLISFSPTFNATGLPTRIEVRARTPDGRRLTGSATASTLVDENLTGPRSVDRSAVQFVQEQRGDQREQVERVTDVVVADEAEANRYAASLMKYRIDRLFTATGELLGDPRVRAGRPIAITGVGRFDGDYYVTEVTHTIGDGGYHTSFVARRSTRPHQDSERSSESGDAV